MRKKPTPEGRSGVKLKEVTYWKWRLSIEEMHHAQVKVDLAVALHKIKAFETTNKIKEAAAHSDKLKGEYAKEKKVIEKEIKMSLNDCSIDPYTYEVIVLPTTGGKNGSNSTT